MTFKSFSLSFELSRKKSRKTFLICRSLCYNNIMDEKSLNLLLNLSFNQLIESLSFHDEENVRQIPSLSDFKSKPYRGYKFFANDSSRRR